MASWRSSSEGSYRSASPASPLSPLSPLSSNALPRWLRKSSPGTALLTGGRLKTLALAIGCILLGWMVTSALGPTDLEAAEIVPDRQDLASSGVLNDPSGFGSDVGVGLAHDLDPSTEHGDSEKAVKAPTIKGALGELHKAVSGKIYGLNPYASKAPPAVSNGTMDPWERKKPANVTDGLPYGEMVKNGLGEEERLGARTRVGKCTIVFNTNQFFERAIKTHEIHDRIHGYRLHVLRQHLMDDVWSKPAYILSLILRELAKPEAERLEWLLWVDADTIILNPYIPIETFLPPMDEDSENIHLLYSNDWNGLNNGVFPVRVNKWSADLFSAIVAYRYFRPDEGLMYRDQSAMDRLMKENMFKDNVVQLPQRWFNAYQGEHNETLAPYQIRRGDLLVHFAGVASRNERMAYWLDRAEQHMEDWEVPLKSTSYPQEVKDFWSEHRGQRNDWRNILSEARLSATQLMAKTDAMMAEYADRVPADKMTAIALELNKMRQLLGNTAMAGDLDAFRNGTKNLEQATESLSAAASESHRLMLAAAHEAIFAGEKVMLEGGLHSGVAEAQSKELEQAITRLKELVLAGDDQWNRATITAAMDAVTGARAKVQEQVAAMNAADDAARNAKEQAENRQDVAAAAAAAAVVSSKTESAAVKESAVVGTTEPTSESVEGQKETREVSTQDPRLPERLGEVV